MQLGSRAVRPRSCACGPRAASRLRRVKHVERDTPPFAFRVVAVAACQIELVQVAVAGKNCQPAIEPGVNRARGLWGEPGQVEPTPRVGGPGRALLAVDVAGFVDTDQTAIVVAGEAA